MPLDVSSASLAPIQGNTEERNMEKMEERMKERKNQQSEEEVLKILISLGEMHFMCG